MAELHVIGDHPDFLDLPWSRPLAAWESKRLVELPAGVHRHVVRFVAYERGVYAVKELPRHLARHEFDMLERLRALQAPAVEPVALIDRPEVDGSEEWASAVVTRYLDYAFSYREVIPTDTFTARSDKLLDAFAHLLVELHLVGCFWGDCSLSNVLYRWDAGAIAVRMVDAETVRLHPELTAGQRAEDIEIMRTNVSWGIADIAAAEGEEPTDAELELGDMIAQRYRSLWNELHDELVIDAEERYRIRERVERVNGLGYEVAGIDLVPEGDGKSRVRMRLAVGGRRFHSRRLFELTRVEASEEQARRILDDLRYHIARRRHAPGGRDLAAMEWRIHTFEPLVTRITAADGTSDPVQGYVDFLHHRYLLSAASRRDIGDDEAFTHWMEAGRPGQG